MHRILQVIGSGAIGGGTTALLSLVRGRLRQCFSVTIASQRGSYIVQEARRNGLAVLELDFSRRCSTPNLTFALHRYIKDAGIDLVHAHGARAGLPVALVPNMRGRVVYTVHGFHFLHKPFGVKQLAREAERLCIARSATTVFVSRHDRDLAITENLLSSEQRGRIIYNGASTPASLHMAPDQPRYDIAFLGRLHAQKNPLVIPDILLALRPARPRMAIIGGGMLEMALRQRLAETDLNDQVTFCGEHEHMDALNLLRQARVMLLPSRFEGLPVSVIEAMHLGIPTVASRVGGVEELIEQERTGFLVKMGDVQGYAAALRELLENEATRVQMGKLARQRAKALFSIEQCEHEHAALYCDLLRYRSAIPVEQAA